MGRPASIVLCPADVVEAWQPFLDKRQPGFKWDGSEYNRPSRNQSVDKEGLEIYMPPLLVLLGLAPTGFPTHSSLRDSFLQVDEKYGILDTSQPRFHSAGKVADIWRKMCADIYQMKKSGVFNDRLRLLVDAIAMRASSSALLTTSPAASPAAASPAASPAALADPPAACPAKVAAPPASLLPVFAEFSDNGSQGEDSEDDSSMNWEKEEEDGDNVVIMSMSCQCSDCQAPIPSAAIGGQKKASTATVAASSDASGPPLGQRRYRVKTTPNAQIGRAHV